MKIKVCIGSSCHLKGSKLVVEKIRELINTHDLQNKIDLSGAFCMSKCQEGVCVSIDDKIHSVKPDQAEVFFAKEVLQTLSQ